MIRRGTHLRCLFSTAVVVVLPAVILLAQDKKPLAESAQPREDVPVLLLTEERPILVSLRVLLDGQPIASYWRSQAEKLFRFLDWDGDGRLDRHESRRLNLGVGGSSPTDYDTDAFISFEEFCRFLRESNFGPVRTGVYLLTGQAAAFTDPSQQLARLLFDRLDLNGNGRLDDKEISAAEQTLRQLDQDEDETLLTDELIRGRVPQLGFGQPGFDFRTNAPHHKSPLLVIADSELVVEQAVRLVQMLYGPTDQAIRRRQLRAEHLNYPQQLFSRLDRNSDGVLDAEELPGLVQRPADVEITLRLLHNGKTGPEATFEPARAHHDLRVDSQPEQVTLSTLRTQVRISARLWTAVVSKQTDSATAHDKMLRNYFRSADRDKNGYLDEVEFAQSALTRFGLGQLPVSFSFADLDRDNDGMVVEREFLAGLEPFLAMQRLVQQLGLGLVMTQQGPGLFHDLDNNGDGKLGIREWRRAAQTLRSLDRNRDGVLERAELGSYYLMDIAPDERIGYGPLILKPMLERPGPGQWSPDSAPRKPTNAPIWFQAMDRNGDGDISRREFVGSEKEFRRLDRDGDGLISLQEALAATAAPSDTKPSATPSRPQ